MGIIMDDPVAMAMDVAESAEREGYPEIAEMAFALAAEAEAAPADNRNEMCNRAWSMAARLGHKRQDWLRANQAFVNEYLAIAD